MVSIDAVANQDVVFNDHPKVNNNNNPDNFIYDKQSLITSDADTNKNSAFKFDKQLDDTQINTTHDDVTLLPKSPEKNKASSDGTKSPTSPKTKSNRSSPTTPKSPTSAKSRVSPFSPENHRKHVSQFKQRQIEKKKSLEERRRLQEMELEKKRQAILKKHEEADKRVQERLKALRTPKKLGTFGTTPRCKSSVNLSFGGDKRKSGSVQNLASKDEVRLRPKSATPSLRRPLSMGALPRDSTAATTPTHIPTVVKRNQKPIIKGAPEKRDERNTVKSKVDIKNLMKPVKVEGFKKTTSVSRSNSNPKGPVNAWKQPSPQTSTLSPRRSSLGRDSKPQPSSGSGRDSPRVESPSKSIMNKAAQNMASAQEEAKLRLEEARRKARLEKAKQDEEARRLEEERQAEEERRRIEAEEARERMLREKEMRRKQLEEEERQKEIEKQKREEEIKREEEEIEQKQQEELKRVEQQRVEQEQRKQKEEERLAKQEEERKERQKKLDAILKRSAVKVDSAPKLEISANASAILAKHNIQLNLGERSSSEQSKTDAESSFSSLEDDAPVKEEEEDNTHQQNNVDNLAANTDNENEDSPKNTPTVNEDNVNEDNEKDRPAVIEAWAPTGIFEPTDNNNDTINHVDDGCGDTPVEPSETSESLSTDDNTTESNVKKGIPDFSIDRVVNDIIDINEPSDGKDATEFTIGLSDVTQLSQVL